MPDTMKLSKNKKKKKLFKITTTTNSVLKPLWYPKMFKESVPWKCRSVNVCVCNNPMTACVESNLVSMKWSKYQGSSEKSHMAGHTASLTVLSFQSDWARLAIFYENLWFTITPIYTKCRITSDSVLIVFSIWNLRNIFSAIGFV